MTTVLDRAIDAARISAESRVRGCSRPIRIKGTTTVVNQTTGEILDSYSSADEIDGTTYVRCGDRRAWLCESCSREYKGDAWHLLTAGLTGGKGTPEDVQEHPALFVTLTAPSFGLVHGLRNKGPCRGRRDKPVCPHGKPQYCYHRHTADDPRLGEPLCADCYDYQGHVVWQWWAPELWRRTTITIGRYLADLLGVARSQQREHVKVSYSKVAEFQARGVVHFHCVMRLDGPHGPASPPPAPLVAEAFQATVTDAVRATTLTKPIGNGEALRLRWGTQIDTRPIMLTANRDGQAGPAHPEQIASYLAKYLTKSTEDFGIKSRIRHPFDARRLRPHVRHLITTAAELTHLDGYESLGERYSTLGYRGHPITKTRRWSTTFKALRQARQHYRQNPGLDPDTPIRDLPADHDDPTETGVVTLRDWTYTGSGHLTDTDLLEAIRTAAHARKRVGEPVGQGHQGAAPD